jgi:hypothetical protein
MSTFRVSLNPQNDSNGRDNVRGYSEREPAAFYPGV